MTEEKLKPLDLEDIWKWFEEKFGEDAMNRYYGYETTRLIEEILQRIKSACEFYLRYKDKPELLIEEHPELKRKCKRLNRWAYESEYKPHSNMAEYNEWLFKLAFKKVIGEKNG